MMKYISFLTALLSFGSVSASLAQEKSSFIRGEDGRVFLAQTQGEAPLTNFYSLGKLKVPGLVDVGGYAARDVLGTLKGACGGSFGETYFRSLPSSYDQRLGFVGGTPGFPDRERIAVSGEKTPFLSQELPEDSNIVVRGCRALPIRGERAVLLSTFTCTVQLDDSGKVNVSQSVPEHKTISTVLDPGGERPTQSTRVRQALKLERCDASYVGDWDPKANNGKNLDPEFY